MTANCANDQSEVSTALARVDLAQHVPRSLETIACEMDVCKRALESRFMEFVARMGQLLIDAKQACPRGEWLRWLDARCELSARQANRYMQVAREATVVEGKQTRATDWASVRSALAPRMLPDGRQSQTSGAKRTQKKGGKAKRTGKKGVERQLSPPDAPSAGATGQEADLPIAASDHQLKASLDAEVNSLAADIRHDVRDICDAACRRQGLGPDHAIDIERTILAALIKQLQETPLGQRSLLPGHSGLARSARHEKDAYFAG